MSRDNVHVRATPFLLRILSSTPVCGNTVLPFFFFFFSFASKGVAVREMCDDEDDYMSASFVSGDTSGHVDPRYDLPSWKRKAAVDKRTRDTLEDQKEHSKKQIREMEVEVREQGLHAPLTKENKGFAMLQKMGYTEGQGESERYTR